MLYFYFFLYFTIFACYNCLYDDLNNENITSDYIYNLTIPFCNTIVNLTNNQSKIYYCGPKGAKYEDEEENENANQITYNQFYKIYKSKLALDKTTNENITIKSPSEEILKYKISIIIPFNNANSTLNNLIRSIQIQTLKEIEIIFIDDLSIDNSTEIINNYSKNDKRIKLFKNEEHKGMFYSRMKGLNLSSGEYIYMIEQNDLLCNEEILEKAYNLTKENNLDILEFYEINEVNKTLFKYIYRHQPYNILRGRHVKYNMFYEYYNLATTNRYIFTKIIRKETFLKVKNYLENDLNNNKIKNYYDNTLINFAIFRVSRSYMFIDEYGYLHNNDYASLERMNNNLNETIKSFDEGLEFILSMDNHTEEMLKDKNTVAYEFYFLLNYYKYFLSQKKVQKKLKKIANLIYKSDFISDDLKYDIKEIMKKRRVKKKNN